MIIIILFRYKYKRKIYFKGKINRHPIEKTKILKEWLIENIESPYANLEFRRELANRTGLCVEQVSTWLNNSRKKKWFRELQNNY